MSGERWLVPLPRGARPPYEVFVNGVPQTEGEDYRVDGRTLTFERRIQKEGRLGFFRWLSMFLGLVGTYRQNDSVDVHYTVNGQTRVHTGLDIVPPESESRSPAAE